MVQYSSGEGSGGCLNFILEVAVDFFLLLLIFLLLPALVPALICWGIIAAILHIFFPSINFFPIKRVYRAVSGKFSKYTGHSLGTLLTAVGIALLGVFLLITFKNRKPKKED